MRASTVRKLILAMGLVMGPSLYGGYGAAEAAGESWDWRSDLLDAFLAAIVVVWFGWSLVSLLSGAGSNHEQKNPRPRHQDPPSAPRPRFAFQWHRARIPRLTGWARVWIVIAAGMWAYGGWHLASNFPAAPAPHRASDECSESDFDPYLTSPLARDCQPMRRRALDANVARVLGVPVETQQQIDAEWENSRRQCQAARRAELARQEDDFRTCMVRADMPNRTAARAQANRTETLGYLGAVLQQVLLVAIAPVVVGVFGWLALMLLRWIRQGFHPD